MLRQAFLNRKGSKLPASYLVNFNFKTFNSIKGYIIQAKPPILMNNIHRNHFQRRYAF